jgi:hypothetical protein
MPTPDLEPLRPSEYGDCEFILSPDKNYLITYRYSFPDYTVWTVPEGKFVYRGSVNAPYGEFRNYFSMSANSMYVKGKNDSYARMLTDGKSVADPMAVEKPNLPEKLLFTQWFKPNNAFSVPTESEKELKSLIRINGRSNGLNEAVEEIEVINDNNRPGNVLVIFEQGYYGDDKFLKTMTDKKPKEWRAMQAQSGHPQFKDINIASVNLQTKEVTQLGRAIPGVHGKDYRLEHLNHGLLASPGHNYFGIKYWLRSPTSGEMYASFCFYNLKGEEIWRTPENVEVLSPYFDDLGSLWLGYRENVRAPETGKTIYHKLDIATGKIQANAELKSSLPPFFIMDWNMVAIQKLDPAIKNLSSIGFFDIRTGNMLASLYNPEIKGVALKTNEYYAEQERKRQEFLNIWYAQMRQDYEEGLKKWETDNQSNTDRKRTENENRCPSCSGNGQVDCSSCGYIYTTESLGMGRTRTTKTIDPNYRGNGKSICSTCHGRGYIFSKK